MRSSLRGSLAGSAIALAGRSAVLVLHALHAAPEVSLQIADGRRGRAVRVGRARDALAVRSAELVRGGGAVRVGRALGARREGGVALRRRGRTLAVRGAAGAALEFLRVADGRRGPAVRVRCALDALVLCRETPRRSGGAVSVCCALHALLRGGVAEGARGGAVGLRVASDACACRGVADRSVVTAGSVAGARGVARVVPGEARGGCRAAIGVRATRSAFACATDAERRARRTLAVGGALDAAERRVARLPWPALVGAVDAAEHAAAPGATVTATWDVGGAARAAAGDHDGRDDERRAEPRLRVQGISRAHDILLRLARCPAYRLFTRSVPRGPVGQAMGTLFSEAQYVFLVHRMPCDGPPPTRRVTRSARRAVVP